MAETAGKFVSPFIGDTLQQLDEDETITFTMPDTSLFNDSLDDIFHAKDTGLPAGAGESTEVAESNDGPELDDSLCFDEEETQLPAAESYEKEVEKGGSFTHPSTQDGSIEDVQQESTDDTAVVPKTPSEEKAPARSSPKHTFADPLGDADSLGNLEHFNANSQRDHTIVGKSSTCEEGGDENAQSSKSPGKVQVPIGDKPGSFNKVVPSFGKRKKGFTPLQAQAATTTKPSKSDPSFGTGTPKAKKTEAKGASESSNAAEVKPKDQFPLSQASGTEKDGNGTTEGDRESNTLTMTDQPERPKFGPPKIKAISDAKSTTRKKAKKQDEKSDNPASNFEKKAEQERRKTEREAKKQEKEQQKMEREQKRAEKERVKDEKKLEQERRKAEREQKKMEKELRKIEREQKKAQKETPGQKNKSMKEDVECQDKVRSDPELPSHSSDGDTDDSSKEKTTGSPNEAPRPSCLEEETGTSDEGETSSAEAKQPEADSQEICPPSMTPNVELVPLEPKPIKSGSSSTDLESKATSSKTPATEVSIVGKASSKQDNETPGMSIGEVNQAEGTELEAMRENFKDCSGTTMTDPAPSEDQVVGLTETETSDEAMVGSDNGASNRTAALSGTVLKENIKPNRKEPHEKKLRGPQVQKAVRIKPKTPSESCKVTFGKSSGNPTTIHRTPLNSKPSKPERKARLPSIKSRKRKAVELASSGSDSHASDQDPERQRSKRERSMPTNHSGPVWVQCGRPDCQRWRQLKDCLDPSDVPDKWECSMNTDSTFNSCSAQEEQWSDPGDSQEYVESPFIPGSIVWARMGGYPWWPAMVEEDPDKETFYEMSGTYSNIPVKYHVVFFDRPVCRAWIPSGLIQSFEGKTDMNELNKVNVPQKYRRVFTLGLKQAEKALPMTVKERLALFTFSKRYRNSTASRKRVKREPKSAACNRASLSLSKSTTLEAPKPGSRKSARLRAASTEPEVESDVLTHSNRDLEPQSMDKSTESFGDENKNGSCTEDRSGSVSMEPVSSSRSPSQDAEVGNE